MSTWSIEPRIQAVGRELARHSGGAGPGLFETRWWSQAAINLAMKDDAFKTQLFRFVDVLPALLDDAHVTTMAREYFGDMSEQVFGSGWGWKAVTATTLGAKLSGKTIRRQVEHMAETFIAGSSIEAALPRLARLWNEGRASSVDLLGEATLSDREADCYRDQCAAALHRLSVASASWTPVPRLGQDHLGPLPRVQLSLKISALHGLMNPADPDGIFEAVARRLRPLLDLAVSLPASIIF
ncbi:MAG TPA: proline dehydrogenase family protein, partial [Nitrospiraceae bacterium]|nr:proline dehydrogenase family protein [Nitrospiraceae bacterium]